MASRLCRHFVRAGPVRMRPGANAKRAGAAALGTRFRRGAGAHDLDLSGLQHRASLSLAGGRAAGCGGHAAAAAAPPARTGHGSSADLCRWLLWRLRAGSITQPARSSCPGESSACSQHDLFSRCSHLSPSLQMAEFANPSLTGSSLCLYSNKVFTRFLGRF